MKTLFQFLVISLLVIASLSSCDNSIEGIDEILKSDTKIETAVSRKINVNVIVKDEYNSTLFYRVEVFDKDPTLPDFNMISVGVARADMVMNIDLMVLTNVKVLYIQQIDPLKNITMNAITIDANTKSVSCDFNTNTILVK